MSALIPTSSVVVPAAAAVADATPILCRGGVQGVVGVPVGSLVTALRFYVQVVPGGDFLPAYDSGGTVISVTVTAGKTFTLPAALFGGYAFKMIGHTFSSGTATESNFQVAISTRIQ